MQPMMLRSHLQQLTVSSLLLFGLFAGAGAWLALRQPITSLEEPMAWLAALCVLGGLALPLALARGQAQRLARSIGSLDALAKAIASNAEAKVPAGIATRELAEAAEKLVHAANTARAREFALRSADRVKDEFLAMLGHELRNPLAAMSAAAFVLRERDNDPGVRQPAEIIERQIQHMTRLIEDLLDLTRIARGKVSLHRQPLDLAKTVEAAVGEMRLAGRLEQHALSIDAAPAWVRADEARLQQLIANLVGNAVKYTPAGGRIAITVRRDRGESILRVQDSGVGMSPELAARAFELFAQGDVTARRGAAGLGIGLALVKHLAELHGGKAFAASSGANQGSVFTVSLPAIEAQPQPEAPVQAAEPHARHRILLVEDNADTRNTMFAALQLDGHRVYEAADGEAGLRAFDTVKPDVALIDIGLPGGLDGYEIASVLHGSPARDKTVLIAMSGFDRPETSRRAREAGFDDYVTKPIAPDRLVRLIDAAFVARARRASVEARRASADARPPAS